MKFRFFPALLPLAFLAACTSSVPTAERLDEIERTVREQHRQDYVILDEQRRNGELDEHQYAEARAGLDRRVQNRVDSMAWSRHALVQSEMKANNIPTPDKPQQNLPPGVGSVQGSLYNSMRQNGIGNQVMGNMMQELGNSNFNAGRAGSVYDNY